MRSPTEPGKPGFIRGVWEAFAIGSGLRSADQTGLGLPLFNALRNRFPGVAKSILGGIATVIGQGVRAAAGAVAAGLNTQIDLSNLPVVPADFHPGEQGDRLIGQVRLEFSNAQTGEPAFRLVWVNQLEILTPQDLIDEAQRLFAEASETGDEEEYKDLIAQAQELIFLAKRY